MDVDTASAARVASWNAARHGTSGRCQSRSAIKTPSVWLLCAGAVAVLPELFIGGVVWLIALAVLPGTVAVVCATALALLLLAVSMRRSARWVRVLLRARAATPAERAVLQPALARIAAAGITETQEADVLLRRRPTARKRTARALRSGGSSSAWVLVISEDLTLSTTREPRTTEIATLLAQAIGRHRAAGELAGRYALTHAVWCAPGRVAADAVQSMPISRLATLRPLLGAGRLVALLVLACGISEGQPRIWSILLSVLAASCLTPRLARRWQAHLDAGGMQAINALQRRARHDAQTSCRRATLASTRAAHLQLVPKPRPG